MHLFIYLFICIFIYLCIILFIYSFDSLLTNLFIYFCIIFKSTPELAKLWNVGCHMWKRDFVAIYNALKEDWSSAIQPIISALQGKI